MGSVTPGRRAALPAALAGVCYSSFLLEHFLSPDLSSVNGYVSELSARDQPYHLVYGGGDFVTGVLVIMVAGLVLRTRPRGWAAVGWTLFGLFGVGAIGDAVFPLDCAPSLDTTCALHERAGAVSFSHQFHAVTSSTVVCFGTLALATLAIAARRTGRWPPLARWGLPLAAAEAGFGLVTVVLMVTGGPLGLTQRIQIAILCAALLLVAHALWTDRPRPGHPESTPGPRARSEPDERGRPPRAERAR
ncbi:DUF998 domain-containing protein [Actinomadura craniellae]|uniref:DUF998 domain-containing protein n=1 Tax=Actinomadura craniellae TaxID=2231787 RepID=A0A365H8T5_9ACTN|nr:DUF998 domain-containing protein [Actinomadura craniellae]RAY15544.1 DUF998 domain-containing protein [Actinomadura craniellae]